MSTRDIVCLNCGYAGMLDIHYERDVVLKDRQFQHLGHNPTPAIFTIGARPARSCSLSIPWRSWEKSLSKGFLERYQVYRQDRGAAIDPDGMVSPGGSTGRKAGRRVRLKKQEKSAVLLITPATGHLPESEEGRFV